MTPGGPASYGGVPAYGAARDGQWHNGGAGPAGYAYPTSPRPSQGNSFLGGEPWHGPPLASWGQRVGSWLIDAGIQLGVLLLGIGLAVAAQAPALAVLGFLAFVGAVITQIVREGTGGQSFGKQALGLRLVSAQTGQPIGVGAALGRQIAHILDWLSASFIVVPIGMMWPLWHKRRQTFADMIAGSVVLTER
jgi:uncharacterized RDD family membrane protein YckC